MASYVSDSQETFCEEFETTVDPKLAEIEEKIRAHRQQRVFMTKPQMKAYSAILQNIHLGKANVLLANRLLGELKQIEKIVEEFEKKWYSSQSTEEGFPCSLLTNQDFVSQVETTAATRQNVQVLSKTTDSPMETSSQEENTESQGNTEKTAVPSNTQQSSDAIEVPNYNLLEVVKLIREFKINLLKDMAAQHPDPTMSFESTTTSLVENEYKLNPEAEAKNKEILFEIQMKAQKWKELRD